MKCVKDLNVNVRAENSLGKYPNLFSFFFNCRFTVHFDKFKAFLPKNALNIKCYSLHLKYLFIWLLHVSVHSDDHLGAYEGNLLKLQSL
jgi:hypothetical protein